MIRSIRSQAKDSNCGNTAASLGYGEHYWTVWLFCLFSNDLGYQRYKGDCLSHSTWVGIRQITERHCVVLKRASCIMTSGIQWLLKPVLGFLGYSYILKPDGIKNLLKGMLWSTPQSLWMWLCMRGVVFVGWEMENVTMMLIDLTC